MLDRYIADAVVYYRELKPVWQQGDCHNKENGESLSNARVEKRAHGGRHVPPYHLNIQASVHRHNGSHVN